MGKTTPLSFFLPYHLQLILVPNPSSQYHLIRGLEMAVSDKVLEERCIQHWTADQLLTNWKLTSCERVKLGLRHAT
jgi:hypothetical protein